MASITGNKYGALTVSSWNETTKHIAVGTTPFLAADFTVGRMAALFTSAGVLKGLARVDVFLTTSTLRIEGDFTNRLTGAVVVPVAGDVLRISWVPSEVAVTGFAVANKLITISDVNTELGTSGVETSLVLYIEGFQILMTTGAQRFWNLNGGVVVCGTLESYENNTVSNGCSFDWRSGTGSSIRAMSNKAHWYQYGGNHTGATNILVYLGGDSSSTVRSAAGMVWNGVQSQYDFIMNGGGSTKLTNPNNHQWINCQTISGATQAIMFRTQDGIAAGGLRKVLGRNMLGVYGSAVTPQVLGNKSDLRTYVTSLGGADGTGGRDGVTGSGTVFWRNGASNTTAVTVYNHVCPYFMASNGWGVGGAQTPVAASRVTMQILFSNTISNIAEGSTAVIERSDTRAIADSSVNLTTGKWLAEVRRKTVVGATDSNVVNAWKLGVKCYGKTVYSNDIGVSTVVMDTGVSGEDVSFAQLAAQLPDTNVTRTQTEALALSSKFTMNATTGVLTVTANATYSEAYDYTVAWNCASAANAQFPNLTQYPMTVSGSGLICHSLMSIVVNTGVTFSSDDVFDEITATTITLNGTGKIAGIYGTPTAGRSTTYELRNVKAGATYIVANNATKATIVFSTNAGAEAVDVPVYFPPGSAGTAIYVARKTLGDFFDYEVLTLEEGLIWTTFVDIPDEGAKVTNAAVLNAYTALETNTKLYDYVTGIYQRTEEGIKLGEFFLREGKQLKWSSPYSAKVNQSAGSLFSKSGNLFTIKATGLAADENFDTNVVVGGGTLTANTNEVLTTEIVDANGDSSLTIQGGSGSYEVWKVANGTPEDDYETGTLLADNVGLGKYRFTGTTGFYILVRDKAKNNRDTCSMEKGTYIIGLYAGKDQITVAQLPEVYEIQNTLALMQIDLDGKPTLNDIEASTVLAKEATVEALTAKVDALPQAGDIVDANIVKVNSVAVDGTGVEGDEWGPVGSAP